MPRLAWQKSSFSTGGEGECIEVASSPPSHLHLRESDRPHETATVEPHALAQLLHAVKSGGLRP